jgi:hypothetical protein
MLKQSKLYINEPFGRKLGLRPKYAQWLIMFFELSLKMGIIYMYVYFLTYENSLSFCCYGENTLRQYYII